MRTIKMFALALFAIAAIAAMAAVAASAAPTELVQTKGTNKEFTVKNTANDVLKASTNVTCLNGVLGSGTLNSSTSALASLVFHKCLTLGGAASCTTTGQPTELSPFVSVSVIQPP